MNTLDQIAAQYQMQTYELAAFLDLGRDYDSRAEITDPAWIIEALDIQVALSAE